MLYQDLNIQSKSGMANGGVIYDKRYILNKNMDDYISRTLNTHILIEKDSYLLLEEMCNDLGIDYDRYDAQDWGIINADAKRVEEFINYFMENTLHRTQQFQVFELIMASYNEAMLERIDTEVLKKIFLEFVSIYNNEKLDIIVKYWKSIYDEEIFQLGKVL